VPHPRQDDCEQVKHIMSKSTTPDPPVQVDPLYDPQAIFHENGPFDPEFIADAAQALMRAHPLETQEASASQRRHMNASLTAMAATHARDPIEVLLAVQALSAHQAACACWRIGMNSRYPHGDSTRHFSAAASAARTFDSLLRAIERRQAKPLSVPIGRPAPRVWPTDKTATALDWLAQRVRLYDEAPVPELPRQRDKSVMWTLEALLVAKRMQEADLVAEENAGLDLTGVEGILPGGGIIMPEHPTPQQQDYIARRLGLMYKREYADNLRNGIKTYPKIRPLRVGDLVP
jgi:hypothetical protein